MRCGIVTLGALPHGSSSRPFVVWWLRVVCGESVIDFVRFIGSMKSERCAMLYVARGCLSGFLNGPKLQFAAPEPA